MDLVRYVLAFGVLIGHFNHIIGTNIPWVISSTNRVGIFFAMSGFLLIGMLLKGIRYQDFLYKRFWRLTPSYVFVILFFGLALCVVSELSPAEYFGSSQFYKYILANLAYLNFLHPELPGAFADTAVTAVNGSLWTMKVEWQLLLLFPIIIMIARRYHINIVAISIFLIIASMLSKAYFLGLYEDTNRKIYEIISRQMLGQISFFCCGVIIYCYYPHFKRNMFRYLLPAAVCYAILEYGNVDTGIFGDIMHPFAMVLMFLMIGLIPGNIFKYIDGGHNISYEIFLTHFPVIQVVKHLGIYERYGTWVTFAIAVTATLILSATIYLTVGRTYLTRQPKPRIQANQKMC